MKRFNTQITLSALTLGLASAIGMPSAPAQAAGIPSTWQATFNDYWTDPLENTNPASPGGPVGPGNPYFYTETGSSLGTIGGGLPGSVVAPPLTDGPTKVSWGRQSPLAPPPQNPPGTAAAKQSAISIDLTTDPGETYTTIPSSQPPALTECPDGTFQTSCFIQVANIVHDNFVINAGTSISGITLHSDIGLVGSGPGESFFGSVDFNFLFKETSNITPPACVVPETPECSDIWVLNSVDLLVPNAGGPVNTVDLVAASGGSNLILPLPIGMFNGFNYDFLLAIGNGIATGDVSGVFRVLTAAECAAVEGAATNADGTCYGFTTFEDTSTPVPIFAQIDAQMKGVPEPSNSAALVGAGLLAFGLLRKRKQSI